MIPSDAVFSLSTESRFIGLEWIAVQTHVLLVTGGAKIGDFDEIAVFMPLL